MKMRILPIACCFLFLSACANVPMQNATLVSTENGREQYAVSGLVMIPKVYDGCTKPYVEKGMSAICPSGLRYLEFMEAFNKKTPVGTWMQWTGKVECK